MLDLPSYIAVTTIPTLVFTIVWFVIGMTVFGLLHWMFSARRQNFWRRDLKTDMIYWFLCPFVYGYIALAAHAYFVDYAHLDRVASAVTGSVASAPILVQAIMILFLTDLLQYWAHRLFHQNPLWRFHSIHHAPVLVDWLTSVRIHPVNFVLYSTLINIIISLVDSVPGRLFSLCRSIRFFSFFVHANLNWTLGPFRYAIASPVFHRWHHTYVDQGGNKNFAPTFPLLDLAFGTFFMPKGQEPLVLGILDNAVPDHFPGQLLYPFKQQKPLADDVVNHP